MDYQKTDAVDDDEHSYFEVEYNSKMTGHRDMVPEVSGGVEMAVESPKVLSLVMYPLEGNLLLGPSLPVPYV